MFDKFDKVHDNLDLLLEKLPLKISKELRKNKELKNIIEVVLDLGYKTEVRLDNNRTTVLDLDEISYDDLDEVTSKVGAFNKDNRAGIERTLHRISAIRNRQGRIIGLTCRIGRAIYGTIEIIRDVIESEKNILLLGPPGIGKTTKLREIARVLSEQLKKRVIVVDTSNEIAGDGDIPHPGIGSARRMQVSSPELQHKVMIEAVENHMPQVIIVDEIGTEREALAARTIAERGVQLVATAHGYTIDNLMKNPTLSDLIGGIQPVILSDEEAKRRCTQKAILERKAPPTFNIVIEIREKDVLAIYHNTARVVDQYLAGKPVNPEIRKWSSKGNIEIVQKSSLNEDNFSELIGKEEIENFVDTVKIYPFAVNRDKLARAIKSLDLPAKITNSLDDSDIVVTTKSQTDKNKKLDKILAGKRVALHVIKKNSASQILKFLRNVFVIHSNQDEYQDEALKEIELIINRVKNEKRPIEANPQNSYIRRLQHQYVRDKGLRAESVGEEPERRLKIYCI